MKKKYHLIRGQRILDQINELLNEVSYAELERNTLNSMPPTEKRQFVVNPVQVINIELIPARESQNITAKATVRNDGTVYNTSALFDAVIYSDADQADNVTFTGSTGDEYHIEPIDLARNNVKVNCNCLDFYWRFATWNHQKNSLDGDPPPPYQRTTNRPPVNPRRVPGVCKHLIKTIIALRDAGIVR